MEDYLPRVGTPTRIRSCRQPAEQQGSLAHQPAHNIPPPVAFGVDPHCSKVKQIFSLVGNRYEGTNL